MMTVKISFLTLTHQAIAHCIVEVDQAILRDQTTLMRHAADNDGNLLRLKHLNIAVCWNYSMRLQVKFYCSMTLLRVDFRQIVTTHTVPWTPQDKRKNETCCGADIRDNPSRQVAQSPQAGFNSLGA